MTSHRESVILAAIAITLVSIPAASQNVEISDGEDKTGVIDSKFSDKFEAEFKPGKVINRVLDKEAKLEVNRSFNKNVKELQTATGYVRIVETNNSIDKTVQTPYGRFEFGVENGENYSRFEGSAEEKAEEVKQELMSKLEERSKEASEKHEIIVQEMLPDVRVSVEDNSSGNAEAEHLNLTNEGDSSVDLSGWSIITEGSGYQDDYNLTSELDAGEKRMYYSEGSTDFENSVEIGTTIYQGGKITVYNSEKRVVDHLNY